jgi:hypothetical protein
VKHLCEHWAKLANEHLKAAQIEATLDRRTVAGLGIKRTPTRHLGAVVVERLRRGRDSYVAKRIREKQLADAQARLANAAERGQLGREGRALDQAIIDTQTSLLAALASRASPRQHALDPQAQRINAQDRWLEGRRALIAPDAKPEPTPNRQLILDSGRER